MQPTRYVEESVRFSCNGDVLPGILARPASPEGQPNCGVLIIVGGPQYRVGSHRQFVLLARSLAAAGFPVLRFDCRGMGDAEGAPRSFEHIGDDIAAALDAFASACPQLGRFVLWGLCDAASAALLYCAERQDSRIAGLCLLNPWVRSEASLARTHVKHYYGQRLLQADFWRKLLSGGLPVVGALRGLLRTLRQARAVPDAIPASGWLPFHARMAEGLRDFDGPVLLILSGDDYVAKEFVDHAANDAAWRSALLRDHLTRWGLAPADHTFSSANWRSDVERVCIEWLATIDH